MMSSFVRLNTGQQMPLLGFGTWQLPTRSAYDIVARAITTGYRHLDTAALYKTEEGVGKAVRASGISRDEFFIVTKIWNADHDQVQKALDRSILALGTIPDLWLMHWPVSQRLRSWKTMETLQKENKVRAIGVSNFTIQHLEELLAHADIIPAVNQVEFSPFLYQEKLLAYCKEKDIQLVAYAPLTHGQKLHHTVLKNIASHYHASTAQLLLAWAYQKGVAAIPKTVHQDRMQENYRIALEITENDMKMLDALHEGFRSCWNPEDFP